MSILRLLFQTLCVFLQKKDRKHIEQNFILLLGSCPRGGTWDAGWVKNFSVGICDGAPSTAHSSFVLFFSSKFRRRYDQNLIEPVIEERKKEIIRLKTKVPRVFHLEDETI